MIHIMREGGGERKSHLHFMIYIINENYLESVGMNKYGDNKKEHIQFLIGIFHKSKAKYVCPEIGIFSSSMDKLSNLLFVRFYDYMFS